MEIKNLSLNSRLKKILATAVAAGITLTSTGCGFSDGKTDVANNPADIIHEVDDSKDNTTVSEESVHSQSNIPAPIGVDNNDESKNELSEDDPIVTDYTISADEQYVTTESTTVIDNNKVTEKGNNKVSSNGNKNNKDNKNNKGNSTDNNVEPKVTTSVKITTTPAKHTKEPEKSTTTTKATTAKTTTTVTTTTTEPVTEPPVTEPVQREYNINDICYDVNAFNTIAYELCKDIKLSKDGTLYRIIDTSYGSTVLDGESKYLLALLNAGSISDEVLAAVFAEYSADDIYNFGKFAASFGEIEKLYNLEVDFNNYACDDRKYVGDYINTMQYNVFIDNYVNFYNDQIVNGNIEQGLYDDVCVKSFYVAYNYSSGLPSIEEFDYSVMDYYNNLYLISHGNSYLY